MCTTEAVHTEKSQLRLLSHKSNQNRYHTVHSSCGVALLPNPVDECTKGYNTPIKNKDTCTSNYLDLCDTQIIPCSVCLFNTFSKIVTMKLFSLTMKLFSHNETNLDHDETIFLRKVSLLFERVKTGWV